MSMGYPKIWTTILHEDWYIKLPANARLMYLTLILMAKEGTDNGQVTVKSYADLANACNMNRKTGTRMLHLLVKSNVIEIKHEPKSCVLITIPRYVFYQDISDPEELQAKYRNKEYKKKPKRTNQPTNQPNNNTFDSSNRKKKKPDEVEDFYANMERF